MARTRRPRLSWFRLYVDDFLGGTAALTAADTGAYVFLLLAQWGTKEVQAIEDDPEELRAICKGVLPPKRVLKKFIPVEIEGRKCLRNERLCQEWAIAKAEFDAKSGVAKGDDTDDDTEADTPLVTEADTAPVLPTIQDPRSKIQDPDPRPGQELSTPPAPTAPPPNQTKQRRNDELATRKPSWSSEACDDWAARYGVGSAPGSVIGAALKPLVTKHGWDVVRPAWQRYLDESTHPAPNANDFRSHFGDWLPGSRTGVSPKARARDEGMRAMIEGGLREK